MGERAPLAGPPEAARAFDEHRGLLLAVAYRILGSVTEAEDAVQDAWLRWDRARPVDVADPRAYLVRVTTRLALDRLRRAKARREAYVGPWLPEPLLTGPDVAEDVERAESVSLALLVVLETLSPLERAVFVLRESFGYSHAEVAAILGRREAAVRQLARRAREHVEARRPRYDADPEARRRVTERFLAACLGGDLPALLAVLAPGVTLVADGGGETLAPRRPLHGAEQVARFLAAIATEAQLAQFLRASGVEPTADVRVGLTGVNGGPGIVGVAGDTPFSTFILDVADDLAQTIYVVASPRKLAALSLSERSEGVAGRARPAGTCPARARAPGRADPGLRTGGDRDAR